MTDTATWNPATYLQFADERARPFADLVAHIGVTSPRRVVDLGCGPGGLTAGLAVRWPQADVLGIDSSTEMVETAHKYAGARVRFEVADLRTWQPDTPVDVLVSNATLQWVPDHLDLLPRLVDAVAPGGWVGLQVPGNFDQASHRLLYRLAADHRFAAVTTGLERAAAPDAATYLSHLSRLGLHVDAWETTYLHVLAGPDPVFRWIAGTGARPVLQALPDAQRPVFEAEYKAMLRDAYPEHDFGTVLPFRRVFVVARRPAEDAA
jgi:trans-aconitate 2-methyltransferase